MHAPSSVALLLIAGLCLPARGAPASPWQTIGRAISVQRRADGVEVAATSGRLRVTFIGERVIRIQESLGRFIPSGRSWAVLSDSLAPGRVVDFRDSPTSVEMASPVVRIRIAKSDLAVTFISANGKVILADDPRRPTLWNGTAFQVWKSMPADEHYFGLGDKGGPLDHRGEAFTMWNSDTYGWTATTDPMYKSVPFFLALRQGQSYGIFLDDPWRSFFDFGKKVRDAYSFGAEGGELDYYFFAGPHPKQVVEDYTALTGRTPLPPLFALGYQQSRWSYPSETRVRQVAREFRERRIPADVLYLDIGYQDGNRPFTVDRATFPHFEQMVRDLGQQGFKVIAITDPHLKKERGYQPYDEGLRGDHFLKNPDGSLYIGKVWPGESVFPEFTRDDTRRWWGTLYRDFVNAGVRGFWNDMNEPAIFDVPGKTMPLNTVHRVDDHTQSHRSIHNVYGMQNARATHEGLLALRPEQRPFVLTRAAFAGTQRYAASWTGDNSSTWDHLRQSVPQLLNLGLSGYAMVGADVGGFMGSPSPDLLTRWTELGAFYPFLRNHTSYGTADQEPWVHGPEHESLRRRYIELRYRLLPYIYTAMEETSRTGLPLMRPLLLEYPREERLVTSSTEFLFGPDLLIAPRLDEMRGPYVLQLPPGDWFDWWTGATLHGRADLQLDPPLDTLPIFVRAGAIVPEQPVVQSTSEIPHGPLILNVYPGPDCHGSLYSDDGESFRYRNGERLRLSFSCSVSAEDIVLQIRRIESGITPWWKEFELRTFGVTMRPQEVLADGTPVAWTYDERHRATTALVSAGTVEVRIRLQ